MHSVSTARLHAPEKKKLVHQHRCVNCGYRFSFDPKHSHFCPNCGQETHNPSKPLYHYILDLVECLFHFDRKSIFTIKTIFQHPGKVTCDYIHGIRGRYTPPNRLFVFSLAVFIIFFELTQVTMIKTDVRNVTPLPLSEELLQLSDTVRIPFSNPFFTGEKIYFTAGQLKELQSIPSEEVGHWLRNSGRPGGLLHRLEARMVRHAALSPLSLQDYNKHIVRIHYEVVFIMMPISALFIFLGFYSRKRRFIDSLVMSIHLYVYGLLVGIAVTSTVLLLIRMGISLDTSIVLPAVMIISLTLNFIPAYKRVFNRSWSQTIARGLTIGSVNMSVQILVFWMIAGFGG